MRDILRDDGRTFSYGLPRDESPPGTGGNGCERLSSISLSPIIEPFERANSVNIIVDISNMEIIS